MRLAMLSKSFLPPSAAAAGLDASEAAKGPRASTPPPKPAFLRNDLRSCLIFVSLSKVSPPNCWPRTKDEKEITLLQNPPDDSLKCGRELPSRQARSQ